jgi:putative membrane protein
MSALLSAAPLAVTPWVGGPWLFPWFLIPIAWITLFVLLFVFLGRRWRRAAAEGYGPGGRNTPTRQAETTLAERYARGDIDEVEYRARLEVLRANAATSQW